MSKLGNIEAAQENLEEMKVTGESTEAQDGAAVAGEGTEAQEGAAVAGEGTEAQEGAAVTGEPTEAQGSGEEPRDEFAAIRRRIEPEKTFLSEIAQDIIKSVLMWIVVTVGAFFYWMVLLCLLSIFLLNIWNTSIEDMTRYAGILTIITSVIYGGSILRKRLK